MKSVDVNWLPWTPFEVSSRNLRLIDLFVAPHDDTEDFARDVAFEAPNGFKLGGAFHEMRRETYTLVPGSSRTKAVIAASSSPSR